MIRVRRPSLTASVLGGKERIVRSLNCVNADRPIHIPVVNRTKTTIQHKWLTVETRRLFAALAKFLADRR
ncbi:Hypothetical protein NTJ_00340 [Nesidiocoris tenuis]|uniref:Uncharacterized protein n=1 Tax=Nesidiocoris tenuis TaxID=355587 RepID=A0ABN7A5V2_9HEMI|nr:Hypothetical protein NTJ_00340 [Nesidiocoris tenuis]